MYDPRPNDKDAFFMEFEAIMNQPVKPNELNVEGCREEFDNNKELDKNEDSKAV
jgi:hypothetical protein